MWFVILYFSVIAFLHFIATVASVNKNNGNRVIDLLVAIICTIAATTLWMS